MILKQKAVYLLAAAALIVALLGTPMLTAPIHAADCPTISSNTCAG